MQNFLEDHKIHWACMVGAFLKLLMEERLAHFIENARQREVANI